MSLCVVFNQDCVTGLLDRISDNYFDAVVTDPPYGLSKGLPTEHTTASGWNNMFTSKGDWDTFDNKEDFAEFTRNWLDACKRKLKDGGNIFVFGTHHNIFITKEIMEEIGLTFRQMLIWYSPNSPPCQTNRVFVPCCEYILWATKGNNYTFNTTKERGIKITKQIKDIFIINSLHTSAPERVEGHPTQKPVELMEILINVCTEEGDLVLEPFLGSGSTMLGCINTNRHCFGFEINEKYIPIIKRKVKWGQEPHNYFLFKSTVNDSVNEDKIEKYFKKYNGILTRNDIIDMLNKGNLE